MDAEPINHYFPNPKNNYEKFMNEWAQSKLMQDPNCSKNEIMHTGNDEWNQIKKDSEKRRLMKLDEMKKKNEIPFSVRDLQGIILDFVNPTKPMILDNDESKLNELLECNTSKMIMVDNFLHMFNSYKKSLKEQRYEINQMLSKSHDTLLNVEHDHAEIQPIKKQKLEKQEIQVREAFYSVASVYELDVNGVSVIRRKSDDWVNATTILKAAGIGKGRKKRKTLENISGNVQIIQGGYWKLQGTWYNFIINAIGYHWKMQKY